MPYINTIDINGEVYNLGNLTDGDYVVDLPELNEDDIFLLRGDVVDNLTDRQQNKPLSANQGRELNEKCADLKNNVSDLKNKDIEIDNNIAQLRKDMEAADTSLGSNIAQLRTDMEDNDAATLSSANKYTDDKSEEVLNSANKYTDDKSAETLNSANKHTDDACDVINASISSLSKTVNDNKTSTDKSIADLQKIVQDNKTAADSSSSDLRTYVDDTFIEKTKIADNLSTDSSEQVLSAKQGKALDDKKLNLSGGNMTGAINTNGIILAKDIDYGAYFPDNAVESQLFFKYGNVVSNSSSNAAETPVVFSVNNDTSDTDTILNDSGWTYTKMQNGIALAWESISMTVDLSANSNNDIGVDITYPEGLFMSAPVCIPHVYGDCAIYQYSTADGKIGVHRIGGAVTGANITINCIAIGRWK